MVDCSVGECGKRATHNGRCSGHRHRHERYGLTDEEMYDLDRGLPCEVCGSLATDVDHDHLSGYTRGYLCSDCNHGLGNFCDSQWLLSNAIDYLRRFNDGQRTGQSAA